MKTSRLLLLSVALLARHLVAQEPGGPGKPHITVSGTAITEVAPDKLVWALELKNTGAELAKVADKHAALTATVLGALKELGIEDKTVQTARMEFGEHRVYRNHNYVKEGYEATSTVSFSLTDFSQYKAAWLRLAAITGLSVQSVNYDLIKRVELQKDTRKKALLAARDKAAVMAETLDAKIGEVLAIEEDLAATEGRLSAFNHLNNVTQAISEPGRGEAGEILAPGTVPIRIRVKVTFLLLNNAK